MQGLIENGRGHRFALAVALCFGFVQAGRFSIANPQAGAAHYTHYIWGAVGGFAGLYLFAWLLRNFGRWFGGQASLREVRTALGWGLLPWTLLFLALIFVLKKTPDASALVDYYWLFFLGFLYGYVILLLSLSAVLRISALKTFLCFIVTFLFSLFPLTLLIQAFSSRL